MKKHVCDKYARMLYATPHQLGNDAMNFWIGG